MADYPDISTAPRDGSVVAVMRICGRLPPLVGMVTWEADDSYAQGGYWSAHDGDGVWFDCQRTGPTHWVEPGVLDYGIMRAARFH